MKAVEDVDKAMWTSYIKEKMGHFVLDNRKCDPMGKTLPLRAQGLKMQTQVGSRSLHHCPRGATFVGKQKAKVPGLWNHVPRCKTKTRPR